MNSDMQLCTVQLYTSWYHPGLGFVTSHQIDEEEEEEFTCLPLNKEPWGKIEAVGKRPLIVDSYFCAAHADCLYQQFPASLRVKKLLRNIENKLGLSCAKLRKSWNQISFIFKQPVLPAYRSVLNSGQNQNLGHLVEMA